MIYLKWDANKYQTEGEAVWSTYIDRGKRKSQEYSREDEKSEEGVTYLERERAIGVGALEVGE